MGSNLKKQTDRSKSQTDLGDPALLSGFRTFSVEITCLPAEKEPRCRADERGAARILFLPGLQKTRDDTMKHRLSELPTD